MKNQDFLLNVINYLQNDWLMNENWNKSTESKRKEIRNIKNNLGAEYLELLSLFTENRKVNGNFFFLFIDFLNLSFVLNIFYTKAN